VQAGDTRIIVTNAAPGATIKVWVNGAHVGTGSAPIVQLLVTVKFGDTLVVAQDLPGCKGQIALEITVACVDPPIVGNPDALNLFPVSNAEYSAGGGVQNIEDRADLIIDSIKHFQSLDADSGSVFFQRIDFQRLGLMGHSRGGDAVVTVPTVIALPGVAIRGVLALAPTNFRFWFGLTTIRPKGYPFMTILPAGDGDVVDNNGAQFYDQAVPDPYKSQLYAHFTCHNLFNRQWPQDEGVGPPRVSRTEHERILAAYGCAFFRSTLLGHATQGYLAGDVKPGGLLSQNVFLSFMKAGQTMVDDHEESNGIGKNTLNLPTVQSGGLGAGEFSFAQAPSGGAAPGAFNDSFFGQTVGMVARPGGVPFRDRRQGSDEDGDMDTRG